MNIYDRARQLVAQSPRPLTFSEALSQLSKRRRPKRKLERTPPPFNVRLPYKDND